MTLQQSPLDEDHVYRRVLELIRQGHFNTNIAKTISSEFSLRVGESSIRRFRKRHKISTAAGGKRGSLNIKDDIATATTAVVSRPRSDNSGPILDDPDAMLRERGLDPAEWCIDNNGITVNQWDGPLAGGGVTTYYQAKFTARRYTSHGSIMPARSEGWRPDKINAPIVTTNLIVVCGDQQAPFHDHRLHSLFCQWLRCNTPRKGILLGDLLDFPDISRHPSDPDNVASVNECIQSGYDIIRDYVAASPATTWQYIRGNHDQRLRQYVIDKAHLIYGMHRAKQTEFSEEEFAHSLAWLLRFDELGVKMVDTNGTYEDSQIVLSPYLAVRHGWVVRQGSGASALKTLEQTNHSIIVGHTHRQSIVFHSTHDIGRGTKILTAVEAGCMCRTDGASDDTSRRFPSYSVYPDWQQGFAVVHLHADARFHISLATYLGNKDLIWNDQLYT